MVKKMLGAATLALLMSAGVAAAQTTTNYPTTVTNTSATTGTTDTSGTTNTSGTTGTGTSSDTSSSTPGTPNTGDGGDAMTNALLLTSTAIIALGGAALLAKRTKLQ